MQKHRSTKTPTALSNWLLLVSVEWILVESYFMFPWSCLAFLALNFDLDWVNREQNYLYQACFKNFLVNCGIQFLITMSKDILEQLTGNISIILYIIFLKRFVNVKIWMFMKSNTYYEVTVSWIYQLKSLVWNIPSFSRYIWKVVVMCPSLAQLDVDYKSQKEILRNT